MAEKRKRVTMTVTVTVPAWMTAAQARREVRTLINHQSNFLDGVFSYKHDRFLDVGPGTVRVRAVAPARD